MINTGPSHAFEIKSKKERVYEYLNKKPNANILELYFEFPLIGKPTLKNLKCMFLKEHKRESLINPETIESITIILKILSSKMAPVERINEVERKAIQYLQELVNNYK